MHDVTQLPATAVPAERISAEPLAEINLDDLVVVYSRGTHRLAQVTKLGPKRIQVIYTTQGAWDTAQKIVEAHLSREATVETDAKRVAAQAAKNYDSYVHGTTDAAITEGLARHPILGRDYFEKDRQKAIQWLVDHPSKDEHVAADVAQYRERVASNAAKAHEHGAAIYVHVTTKSVPRDEVYGLVASGALVQA